MQRTKHLEHKIITLTSVLHAGAKENIRAGILIEYVGFAGDGCLLQWELKGDWEK